MQVKNTTKIILNVAIDLEMPYLDLDLILYHYYLENEYIGCFSVFTNYFDIICILLSKHWLTNLKNYSIFICQTLKPLKIICYTKLLKRKLYIYI